MAVFVIAACSSTPTPTPSPTDYPPPLFISSPDCEGLEHGMLPLAILNISSEGAHDITVQVEVADEASERSQGLMCRKVISAGTGMLFTYDADRSNGFWMFNTYAPIDILYLDQFGYVVDKITMLPCTRAAANRSGENTSTDSEWRAWCVTEANKYVPSGPWRNTLELPAGWLEAQGVDRPLDGGLTVSWTALLP